MNYKPKEPKETRKQIVEQTRNAVARQYNHEIDFLKGRIKILSDTYEEERRKLTEVQDKVASLEEELNQYKDWVERLLSYMDMNEEDRKAAIARDEAKYITNQKMNSLLDLYSKMLNLTFR